MFSHSKSHFSHSHLAKYISQNCFFTKKNSIVVIPSGIIKKFINEEISKQFNDDYNLLYKLSDDIKDRLTVYLHLEKGKLDAKIVRRLLVKEILSEGMKEKIVEAVEDGTLYKWYKVVSFIDVPDSLLQLKAGSGLTSINEEKISEFSIGEWR